MTATYSITSLKHKWKMSAQHTQDPQEPLSARKNKRFSLPGSRFGVTLGAGVCCFAILSLYASPGEKLEAAPVTHKESVPSQQALESPYSQAGSYLAARHARMEKDNGTASFFFSHALSHDPYDVDVMKETIRTYILSGKVQEAAKVAQKLSGLQHSSQISRLVLFTEALKNDNYIEANSELEKMQHFGLFGLIKPVLSAWVETRKGQAPDEIKLPDTLHGMEYFNHLIHYQLALMNDMAGNKRQAREHYQQALKDMSLASYRMVVAAMQFYHRNGENEMAARVLADFSKANPSSQLLEGSNYDEIVKDLPDSEKDQLVHTASEGVAEFLYTVAGILFSEDVSSETQMYLRLALYLRPDMEDGRLMLGNLMEDQDELQQASDFYREIGGNGPIYRRAQIRLAFTLDEMGKENEAVTILNKLAARFPDKTDHYTTLGDIYRGHAQYPKAVEAYTSALKTMGDKITQEDWPVLFARGISYERSGAWDMAEKDFKTALKLYPDQPDVLNYLGYSWLVKGQNIEEAKKMLEQAVNERPEDPHIIDSMGWACYLMGDYPKALSFLEQAVDRMPHDPTVNDHLGDILFRLGRTTEAKFQWERALTFGPEQEDRQRIEGKLKAGLPAETKKLLNTAKN